MFRRVRVRCVETLRIVENIDVDSNSNSTKRLRRTREGVIENDDLRVFNGFKEFDERSRGRGRGVQGPNRWGVREGVVPCEAHNTRAPHTLKRADSAAQRPFTAHAGVFIGPSRPIVIVNRDLGVH